MLAKKFNCFCKAAARHFGKIKNRKITEPQFDALTKKIIADGFIDLPGIIYGRGGFVFVNEIEKCVFQLACFQMNTFGAGAFGKKTAEFCTPILMTVKVHGAHPYLSHNLREAVLSMEDFYLGKHYSGSKGPACDRASFNAAARKLFLTSSTGSFNHRISWRLINANYICHHIAETMGYAYGALDSYWRSHKNMFFLTSSSVFNEKRDKLSIDIIDDFSAEKMRAYFQVPRYAVLKGEEKPFSEGHDVTTLEVTYRNDIQFFCLPSGYQKINKKLFNENVRVITTQHIVEHVLTDYYRRPNAFVVANTFQILEYLSRGILAKIEGKPELGARFIRDASSCKGQRPESDMEKLLALGEDKYSIFASEFAYNMFFRPPVIT
jgi:hypothetical protein